MEYLLLFDLRNVSDCSIFINAELRAEAIRVTAITPYGEHRICNDKSGKEKTDRNRIGLSLMKYCYAI